MGQTTAVDPTPTGPAKAPGPLTARQLRELPEFCRLNSEADRCAVFAQLRDLWSERYPGSNFGDLAEWLGVVRPRISQWASGNGGKGQPPWWALNRMAYDLGLVFVVDGSGIAIHRKAS